MPEQSEQPEGAAAPHVLTQDEVDHLVEKVRASDATIEDLKAAVLAKDATIEDLKAAVLAKDAEITELRQKVVAWHRANVALAERLQQATNPVHGIEAPRKLDDLPKLDEIPPHPVLPTDNEELPRGSLGRDTWRD